MKLKKRISGVIYHFLMIMSCLIMLYPLLWMISSSFKDTHEIMRTSNELIPRNPTLQNYITGWKGFGNYTFTTFFKNSIFVSVCNTIGTVVSASLTAFAFARIKFTGRKFLFAIMIGTMCLPGMVTQIPRFLMYLDMGWVGTWLPLLVPAWLGGGAFNIFLLMQFMRGIPKDMDEAAEIDGCGWFGLYKDIMLPLIMPAIASVAILTFIGNWGDYYSALIYLNKPQYYPVAYALKLYTDEANTNFGPMMAMSVCSILPIMILFFIFQKTLVEGVAFSGIKG